MLICNLNKTGHVPVLSTFSDTDIVFIVVLCNITHKTCNCDLLRIKRAFIRLSYTQY